MVNSIISANDAYIPNSLVYSKINAIEIAISSRGMDHTRNGVHELGSGWLFICPMKVLKSRNLLMLA